MNAPTNTAYTTGPWSVEADGTTLTMGNQIVATAVAPDGASIEEQRANARLIAAAPSMHYIIRTLSQRQFDVQKLRAAIDAVLAYVSGQHPKPEQHRPSDWWTVASYPACNVLRGPEAEMRAVFNRNTPIEAAHQSIHLIDDHGTLVEVKDGWHVEPTTPIIVTDLAGKYDDPPESMVGLIQSLVQIADAKPSDDENNAAQAAQRYQIIAREALREIGVES